MAPAPNAAGSVRPSRLPPTRTAYSYECVHMHDGLRSDLILSSTKVCFGVCFLRAAFLLTASYWYSVMHILMNERNFVMPCAGQAVAFWGIGGSSVTLKRLLPALTSLATWLDRKNCVST